jgi:hypothetical protein
MIQEGVADEYESESGVTERSFHSSSNSVSFSTRDSLNNVGYFRNQECKEDEG